MVPEEESSFKFLAKHYFFIINCLLIGLVLYALGTYALGLLAQKPTATFFVTLSSLWLLIIVLYWVLLT